MKIDIVCSEGSPIGLIPEDIDGRGVGGAELALMTTAEQWAKNGHDVRVYNNPKRPGAYSDVVYCPIGDWSSHRADTLIIFRTPYMRSWSFQRGKKIFWSCDQYTVGNFEVDVFPAVDTVVTISQFHTDYFVKRYKLSRERIATINIGVRTWEYEQEVEKVPGRVIFCSVPERGLGQLRQVWNSLTEEFPLLSLVITSDYRLWGAPTPMNENHKRMWAGVPNVSFLGKISRKELVLEQLKAQWMLYPCIYDELFCISLAECQVAGALPMTSGAGALGTTNVTGVALPGDPRTLEWQKLYTDVTLATMRKQELVYDVKHIKRTARNSFGFLTTLAAWDEVLQ